MRIAPTAADDRRPSTNPTIAGELAIDTQTDVPKVRAALKGGNIELELGMFFRNSRYFDTTKGKIQGHVSLGVPGSRWPRR